MLISALVVLPHIDYACLIYNDIPAYLNLKVQRLVNAAIRFIFNLRRDSSISNYCNELGWLPVEKRRMFFFGCLTRKILCTSRPSYLYEPIIAQFSDVRRSTRIGNAQINLRNYRTEAFKQAFCNNAARFRQSLDENLRNCESLSLFPEELRKFLIVDS